MPKVSLPTPKPVPRSWAEFRAAWGGGCGNDICAGANRIVLARGRLPADVLLVGEAPGESEDVLGIPFVGPAGKLLDRILAEALGGFRGRDGGPLRLAFSNLVGCIPRGGDGAKLAEPEPHEIEKCRPRLEEFARFADPKMIVLVGALARNNCSTAAAFGRPLGATARIVDIVHPAAILRANTANQGLLIQTAMVRVQNAAEEMFDAADQ